MIDNVMIVSKPGSYTGLVKGEKHRTRLLAPYIGDDIERLMPVQYP
jgi:hypothetical protein